MKLGAEKSPPSAIPDRSHFLRIKLSENTARSYPISRTVLIKTVQGVL
ncbi:hypothetical protein PG357_06615 [Riemerella anatipestifer]|nr:hypothetical protein [Riemerella anatipestifer]